MGYMETQGSSNSKSRAMLFRQARRFRTEQARRRHPTLYWGRDATREKVNEAQLLARVEECRKTMVEATGSRFQKGDWPLGSYRVDGNSTKQELYVRDRRGRLHAGREGRPQECLSTGYMARQTSLSRTAYQGDSTTLTQHTMAGFMVA